MHRIDTPGHENGMFSPGNPVAGIEGTVVGFDWLNALQEEVAGVIEPAPSSAILVKGTNTQLRTAILSIVDNLSARVFTFIAPEDLTAGEGYLFRETFGVIRESVLSAATANMERSGTFTLDKNATEPMTAGDRVYWNQAGREVRNTAAAGAHDYIGICRVTELAAATTVSVLVGQPQNA